MATSHPGFLVALSAGFFGLLVPVMSCTEPRTGPEDDAATPVCSPELVDAGLGALCDAGPALPPPAPGGGSGESGSVQLEIQSLSGKCEGQATSDNGCTLAPSTATATLTLGQSGSPNVGALVMQADGTWVGSINGAVKISQPVVVATKTCPPAGPAPCNDFAGIDETQPFSITARTVGGTRESAAIELSTSTLQPPSSCTDKSFEPTEGPTVVLRPQHTIGAYRKSPVTVTGSGTFPVSSFGLVGTLTCDYTVTLRPLGG